MPHAVAERLQREFGITFAEGYGLTETAAPSHSNPPERAKLQCLGIPLFGTDSRIIDPETLQELPDRRDGRDRHPRARWSSRATGATPRPRAAAFIEIDGKPFFRTGDLGRRRRGGLLLPHRPAQAHDQRQRLQGLAERGRTAALQVPAGAGGLRHRGTRRLPRRNREGLDRAAQRSPRRRHRAGHHRLGARAHGRLQGAAHRASSSTRCPRAARAR